MAKEKKRAEQYEKPLAIKGSFQNLVKLSVTDKPIKKQLVQAAKKSK